MRDLESRAASGRMSHFWAVADASWRCLNALDNVHAADHAPKHHVMAIQVRCRNCSRAAGGGADGRQNKRQWLFATFALNACQGSVTCGDEELRAVGVGPGICHAEKPRACVLELKRFVFKRAPVDRVAADHRAPLDHEAADHSVERCALVSRLL